MLFKKIKCNTNQISSKLFTVSCRLLAFECVISIRKQSLYFNILDVYCLWLFFILNLLSEGFKVIWSIQNL